LSKIHSYRLLFRWFAHWDRTRHRRIYENRKQSKTTQV